MKKAWYINGLLSLVLSASVCTNGISEETSIEETRDPLSVFVHEPTSFLEAWGGALFLQPYADNLGWAVITNFLPFITPTWSVETLSPGYHPCFEIGARYFFPHTGIDLEAAWTDLRSSHSQSLSVTPILQWVSPFCQTGPGTANTTYDATGVGKLTKAYAEVKFQFDLIDVDVATSIQIGVPLELRLSSGLSYARIKESLFSTFEHPSGLPQISLTNTSTYWGIGPKLGMTSNYRIYKGLHFIGKGTAALFFGRKEPAQYLFEGSSDSLSRAGIPTNFENIASKTVSQVVPSFEGKLALEYTYKFYKCYQATLEAGYLGCIYLNSLSGYETNENILALELGSLSTGSMKQVLSNFSLSGPYVTLSLRF